MNNFLRFVFQALGKKGSERLSAPIVSAPDTTTETETVTLTETTFPYVEETDSTTASPTSLFSCGTGVRFSSTHTITASSNYTWVKGPWICPGCWVHIQSSGSIIASLGSGVTGNLYPEGYYGNTITGVLDPEPSRTLAKPWLTQTVYPPGVFLTNRPKPYSLQVCLGNYYSTTGNPGSEYVPRNLFVSWGELYSSSTDKPTPGQGGFLWYALNHNGSGLSGTITVKFDVYFECNTIDIPVTTTTTGASSTTASSTTTSSTTTSSTTASTTPDTETESHIEDSTHTSRLDTDTTTAPGDGWTPPE